MDYLMCTSGDGKLGTARLLLLASGIKCDTIAPPLLSKRAFYEKDQSCNIFSAFYLRF